MEDIVMERQRDREVEREGERERPGGIHGIRHWIYFIALSFTQSGGG